MAGTTALASSLCYATWKVILFTIIIICVSGTTISPRSPYTPRTSAIFLEELDSSTEDVSSSGSGDSTPESFTSPTSETPTFTNTNFAASTTTKPACSCPTQILDPNQTYTYINVTNNTGRQKANFVCTFQIEWSPTRDPNASTAETPGTPSPGSADSGLGDSERDTVAAGGYFSPARKSLQLTVTILCLVILFACVCSPLPFRSNLYIVFPKNSGGTQVTLVVGVILLFVISIVACLRNGELPLYADHIAFLICYSALLANAFNLFLIAKFSIILPEKVLAACAVFCAVVGSVNALTCYQARVYIEDLNTKVSRLEVAQYELLGTEFRKINVIETGILENLQLIGYVGPQLFLLCAAIISALMYRTSKYAKILCFTCVALIIVHTVHLKILRLPESRLCIACAYVFLLGYIVPITVCAFKFCKMSFFRSGTDDTKKLLVHEEKNV
ncbi:protein E1 [Elephant endotheliotropic herpesvirus 2]|nr:protein E1 [Elephant endotheliotropic herpesvirus 2]